MRKSSSANSARSACCDRARTRRPGTGGNPNGASHDLRRLAGHSWRDRPHPGIRSRDPSRRQGLQRTRGDRGTAPHTGRCTGAGYRNAGAGRHGRATPAAARRPRPARHHGLHPDDPWRRCCHAGAAPGGRGLCAEAIFDRQRRRRRLQAGDHREGERPGAPAPPYRHPGPWHGRAVARRWHDAGPPAGNRQLHRWTTGPVQPVPGPRPHHHRAGRPNPAHAGDLHPDPRGTHHPPGRHALQ